MVAALPHCDVREHWEAPSEGATVPRAAAATVMVAEQKVSGHGWQPPPHSTYLQTPSSGVSIHWVEILCLGSVGIHS